MRQMEVSSVAGRVGLPFPASCLPLHPQPPTRLVALFAPVCFYAYMDLFELGFLPLSEPGSSLSQKDPT